MNCVFIRAHKVNARYMSHISFSGYTMAIGCFYELNVFVHIRPFHTCTSSIIFHKYILCKVCTSPFACIMSHGTNYGSAFLATIYITNISSFRYFSLKQISNHLVHLLSFEADIPVYFIMTILW